MTEHSYDEAIRKGDAEKIRQLKAAGVTPPELLMFSCILKKHPELLTILADIGCDPDERDYYGETALGCAISQGKAQTVETLLRLGANPNKKTLNTAPLAWAVIKGHSDVLQILIRHGAVVNYQDEPGGTALLPAVRMGNVEIARILIRAGADAYHYGADDLNAFELAEREGQQEMLEMLRAEVKSKAPKERRSPTQLLMKAIDEGNRTEVDRCIAARADLNARSRLGWSPLEAAIEKENAWLVKKLLDSGANPNNKGPRGSLPLEMAACTGNLEIVMLLMKSGAKLTKRRESNLLLEICHRGDAEVAKILLDAGADPNVPMTQPPGTTPLLLATSSKSVELVDLLLKRGANVAAVDQQGNTALFPPIMAEAIHVNVQLQDGRPKIFSVEARYNVADNRVQEIVSLLLKHGSEVNHQDEHGRTALTYAVSEATARLLIDAGAKLDIVDKKGHDVRYWLKKNGLLDMLTERPVGSREPNGKKSSKSKFSKRRRFER